MSLDVKESEIGDNERRGSAEKSSSSVGQGKKRRHKVCAQKFKTSDDAPNESDEEDNLDANKEAKVKSRLTNNDKRKTRVT